MQPTTDISLDMPRNEDKFDNDFFRRFSNKSIYSLDLDGIKKTYSFPTFYSNTSCAIGIFFCDYEAAFNLMPHSSMFPLRMLNGQTLVIFSCYEYKEVYNVWPYNEVAMAIPVMFNGKANIPILPMFINSLFQSFGYYVFLMPVTSRENQIRGNKIWGLPKVTQRIDINIRNDECSINAYEKDENYFSLCVPTKGKMKNIDTWSNIYGNLDGNIKKAKTFFKGTYAMNNNFNALWKNSGKECLKIGFGPSADILHSLKINPYPLQLRYAQNINAAFLLPF